MEDSYSINTYNQNTHLQYQIDTFSRQQIPQHYNTLYLWKIAR